MTGAVDPVLLECGRRTTGVVTDLERTGSTFTIRGERHEVCVVRVRVLPADALDLIEALNEA